MAFEINYKQRMSKILNISIDEANELLKRGERHLKKNGTNRHELARMFFILEDIYTRKEEQRIKDSAPLLGFKHKGIERYRGEIIRMHEDGTSAEKVAKHLCRKKDAPSLSTIKRYLKAVRDWRENGLT
jgi:hypothetical protein